MSTLDCKLENDFLIKDLKSVDSVNSYISSAIVIAQANNDLTIVQANRGYFDLLGYTKQELYDIYKNKGMLTMHHDDLDKLQAAFNKCFSATKEFTFNVKVRVVHKECGHKWVHVSGRGIPNKDGAVMLYCSLIDITDYVALMDKLENEQIYNRLIMDLTNDSFFDLDIETLKLKHSQHFAQRFNIPSTRENYLKAFISSGVVSEESMPDFMMAVEDATVRGLETGNGMHLKLCAPDNDYIWYTVHYKILFDKWGKPSRVIGKLTDITKQKIQIDTLKRKAETDPLTKLYNKEETRLRIERCLKSANPGDKFALIMADIDNFKGLNDRLGHQFGDAVLIDISAKLKLFFRDSDIIGRVGGDEFIVFINNIKSDDIIFEKAKELCDAFRHTYSGEINEYKISCSIGIALCPKHAKTFDELYRLADIALYESKRKNKDCYTIYDDNLSKTTLIELEPTKLIKRFTTNYFIDDIIHTIFEMLYETKDIEITISMILGIIGKEFDVDKCSVYEFNENQNTISVTYEWCNKGISKEINNMQNMPVFMLDDIISQFNEDGIYYCSDISNLEGEFYTLLKNQNTKSILRCIFYENGVMKGFVGFDSCKTNRNWSPDEIAILNYMTKILSTFITKDQISKELLAFYERHIQMLENLNGYVYVIDKESHETLYLNKLIKSMGYKVGQKCHRIWFDSDTPCENCPANLIDEKTKMASLELMTPLIGGWINAAASKITWSGQRDALLVCCTDITKYKSASS